MAKESTISKLKWAGVSAIISSIVTFISTSLMNYFYKTITTVQTIQTFSLYMIPVILGIVGSFLLISCYILSKKIEVTTISGDIFLLIPSNISIIRYLITD
jgi:hypothetical protein